MWVGEGGDEGVAKMWVGATLPLQPQVQKNPLPTATDHPHPPHQPHQPHHPHQPTLVAQTPSVGSPSRHKSCALLPMLVSSDADAIVAAAAEASSRGRLTMPRIAGWELVV